MTDYLQRESNKITIANFYEGYELNKYNFNPPYQRKSLWTEEKKSFLIDSIVRNYPIPPIFLHQRIDDTTGKTSYDIIDGKQRLTAIVEFIENKIPVSSEHNDTGSDEKLSGLYFKDLDGKDYIEHKGRFWRYVIPIEYVDTGDGSIIDSIFDRLNRNGEPLTGQELRHSTFYGTPLLEMVEGKAKSIFWKKRLEVVDKSRMEEVEFLSELSFLILEKGELHADQEAIDGLYEKYANSGTVDYQELSAKLDAITGFMDSLEIDYEKRKLTGVSHLYGLFSFCYYCVDRGVSVETVKSKVQAFFDKWQAKDYSEGEIKQYKDSMSARTKDKGQRIRRTKALLTHCDLA